MTLLVALFLVVHACVHVGYICGPAWPFEDTTPWLVGAVGAGADMLHGLGVLLVLLTLGAGLIAAASAVGLLPARVWVPAIILGAAASAAVLVLFATPWTTAGIAIDIVLAWAVLRRHWRPRPLVRGRRSAGPGLPSMQS